jgi:hypothetical protein
MADDRAARWSWREHCLRAGIITMFFGPSPLSVMAHFSIRLMALEDRIYFDSDPPIVALSCLELPTRRDP